MSEKLSKLKDPKSILLVSDFNFVYVSMYVNT